MPLMIWDAKYELGIPAVDAQHHKLFDALNQLHDAMKQGKGKDEMGKVLAFLQDYTLTHFRDEEALQSQKAYSKFTEHKRIHDDLVAKVREMSEKHARGEFVVSMPLMDFLEAWLKNHILQEDKAFAEEFKRRGV